MTKKGDSWNESETYRDSLTLRKVRRITSRGLFNETPNYHTNIGFSADGEHLIFTSGREGYTGLFRVHVPSGDLTLLTEPVPHLGSWSDLNKGTGTSIGDGLGIASHTCLAPRSGWAVYVLASSLRAVNIYTLEERILIEDFGLEWAVGVPSIDCNEEFVILPMMLAHPDILAGRRPDKTYLEHFAAGGNRMCILQVPLMGGAVTTLYQEEGAGSAHAPHSPTDPHLILLDRDMAPRYWAGSDGKTNRIWILHSPSGGLTELTPRDVGRFQVHCAWTWDGEGVVYHGPSAKGGWYIGAIRKNGESINEYGFHQCHHYGHVSAMAGRPAIILDGNLTSDCLLWLYYDQEQPRVEIIARHGTTWDALPNQFPHPHPLSDPTGRYISFNCAAKGRSDVYIVEV